MVLRSTPGANVPVYQVAGANSSRSLPDWLIRKRRQALKKDGDFNSRVELIQDFEFAEASNKIKVTRDGQFAMATGTYKPQIHVYDFNQLSLKFDRHTDAENVDFVLISDDWTKSIHLQNDRSIEFHAQGGIHTRTRIPKFGRALAYCNRNCDLFVAASDREIFRLNVDQGRFLAPLESDCANINCVDLSSAHGLLAAGGDRSMVEMWDTRSRQRVGILEVGSAANDPAEITAVKFNNDGLHVAVGSSDGYSRIYDLRSSSPIITKDQGYGLPVKAIGFLETSNTPNMIFTADKNIVKIWDRETGNPYTSLEPSVEINDVAHVPDSGMFFLANEGMPMHTYYVPSIGPAPKWCSFLDSITEELEEKTVSSVFDNFKFVTTKQLEQLGLGHIVGTAAAKPYMHGYFIDMKLYEEARLISDPYAYREHREREIRRKIEKERESRIRATGAVGPTVNVNKTLHKESKAEIDDRFSALFDNPEFEIDEHSYEYRLLHGGKTGANGSGQSNAALRTTPRKLTAAEEEDEDENHASESESDQENAKRKRERKPKNRRPRRTQELEHREPTGGNRVHVEDNSFSDRLASQSHRPARTFAKSSFQPQEKEISFAPRRFKPQARKPRDGDFGRTKPRHASDRRSASKNTFRNT